MIAGPYVAFTDQAPGPGAWKVGIFNYGSGTVQPVPGGTGSQHQPAVSGPIVAFTVNASGYGQVWIYDLIGGGSKSVSPTTADQGHPAVGQGTVFWEDARAGGKEIWFMNLIDQIPRALPEPGVRPRASGTRVVYLDPVTRAVKLCDTSVSTPVPALIHAGPADSADIQGNNVAISLDVGPGPPSPPSHDIFVYTVAGQPVAHLALPGDQVNPHISGNWVAFEDRGPSTSAPSSRVVLWDYTSATPVLLAPPSGTSLQTLSDIDYPRTVYADDRSGNLDVYAYDPTDTGGVPPPPPDGGTPDGGCHRECDDDGEDCDDDHGGHGDDDRHGHGEGDRHGHGEGEHGHRDGGHGRDGGDHHDDCDDEGPHHRDGGTSACDEGEVLADLAVERQPGKPATGAVEFEAGPGGRVGICIEAEHVSSAWVTVNDRVVAGPRSFDPRVARLFRRATVPEGTSRVGATIAGRPGGSLRVRVLRGPALSRGTSREREEAPPNVTPAGGCGTGAGGGVALGALLVAVALRRRLPR